MKSDVQLRQQVNRIQLESLEMLPCVPCDDMADGLVKDAIFSSQRTKRNTTLCKLFSDSENFYLRELGKPVPLAPVVTILRDTIRSVVLLRSEKQMAGIDTRRVVAAVQDVESNAVKQRPMRQLISYESHPQCRRGRGTFTAPKTPVSVIINGSKPEHATTFRFCLRHIFLKTLKQRKFSGYISAGTRTERPAQVRRNSFKSATAMRAYQSVATASRSVVTGCRAESSRSGNWTAAIIASSWYLENRHAAYAPIISGLVGLNQALHALG